MGVDNPWPWGVSVHKNFVWLGAINTVVLIASSVGVVFAWVALKERKWRQLSGLMYFVVACAVVFMCLKTVEYNSKLNHHHGIKLTDNSVMEGTILDKTDRIRFQRAKRSASAFRGPSGGS
jgi:heme/copper-type cytochrome/quinol oxidase subunit 3